jgi:hypothetical protein
MEKRHVKVFVSYARANKDLARRFLDRFKEQAEASMRCKYTFWQDKDLLVGEDWQKGIDRALDGCDLGLLLVSPAFLGSQYITSKELPRFVGDGAKPVIPVMLQPVEFGLHDFKGLAERQIFRLERPGLAKAKAFASCSNTQRDEFALELLRQVEARLAV